MGKLDIKDREYFSDSERFAEIFNVNVYHGEKVLLPENLVLLNRKLVYKMEKEELPMCKAFNDLMKEQRRDGMKAGRREGKREGKKEGKKEEKLQIIRRMLKAGMDEKMIVQMTKCTREELGMAAGR